MGHLSPLFAPGIGVGAALVVEFPVVKLFSLAFAPVEFDAELFDADELFPAPEFAEELEAAELAAGAGAQV